MSIPNGTIDYPETGNCTCGHHWEFHLGGRYDCQLCKDRHCKTFKSLKDWDAQLDRIRNTVTFASAKEDK